MRYTFSEAFSLAFGDLIVLGIIFAVVWNKSKDKEKGTLKAIKGFLIYTGLVFVSFIGDLGLIKACITSFPFVPLLAGYIYFKIWNKNQQKEIEQMGNIINAYISKQGYTLGTDFQNYCLSSPDMAKAVKMKYRNPYFNPETPKERPYVISYIEYIMPKYTDVLRNFELNRMDEIVQQYIQKNGYVLPEAFETYCNTAPEFNVARSIKYPFNSSLVPTEMIGEQMLNAGQSTYIDYCFMIRMAYENAVRKYYIGEMDNVIQDSIISRGYVSQVAFAQFCSVNAPIVAVSVVYDKTEYVYQDGKIFIPGYETPDKIRTSYTTYIVQKYKDVVIAQYMKDLLAYAQNEYMFDYDDLYQATPEYHAYFVDNNGNADMESYKQASAAVLNIMLQKKVLKKIMGEGIAFQSTVISEADAMKNGDFEMGQELVL